MHRPERRRAMQEYQNETGDDDIDGDAFDDWCADWQIEHTARLHGRP